MVSLSGEDDTGQLWIRIVWAWTKSFVLALLAASISWRLLWLAARLQILDRAILIGFGVVVIALGSYLASKYSPRFFIIGVFLLLVMPGGAMVCAAFVGEYDEGVLHTFSGIWCSVALLGCAAFEFTRNEQRDRTFKDEVEDIQHLLKCLELRASQQGMEASEIRHFQEALSALYKLIGKTSAQAKAE